MENAIEVLGKVFTVSLARYVLIAGIPFLFFYSFFSGRLEKSRIQKRLAKKKDLIREVLHSLSTTIVFTVIAFVILFTPFKQYTLMYDNLHDYPSWYLWVSLALSLVIHDTYFYWMHRMLHHPKIYRYTHKLHHQSVTPSPWASYSFSILEAIAEGMVLVVLVFILPMHHLTIILFTVVGLAINVYGHLGYEIAPRSLRNSWLFEILNTSTHHNLHHSRFNGNYGLYFRFWDRVMGTENPDYVKEYDRMQEKRFGTLKVEKTERGTRGVA